MVKKRTILWGSSLLLPTLSAIALGIYSHYDLREWYDKPFYLSWDFYWGPLLVFTVVLSLLPWVLNLLWLGVQRLLRAMAQRDIRNLQVLHSSGVLSQEEYEQRLAPLKTKL
jgi:hypothetical protein